jgi:hypothetical protein
MGKILRSRRISSLRIVKYCIGCLLAAVIYKISKQFVSRNQTLAVGCHRPARLFHCCTGVQNGPLLEITDTMPPWAVLPSGFLKTSKETPCPKP